MCYVCLSAYGHHPGCPEDDWEARQEREEALQEYLNQRADDARDE